ncbi:CPBP family intramembrane metalloprotease, partial [Ruminococcaceae bacterium OttesenSCG-928-O06]|nr:CPBP family intramembrane metalloprotease [Ruminococcaceae bacterium OttesenSCG-928-O06]
MDTKRDPKRICTYIGLGLFAMMSIWLLGMMGLQVLFMRYAPALLYSTWGMWLLNDIPLYLLGLPLFLLILRAVPNGPAAARPTQKFGPAQFLMAVAFSLGATYLINFVTSILMMLMQYFLSGSFDSVGNALEDIVTGSSLLPNILFGTIVPALGEEFIFRYTIRKKMQGCSDKSYILFSAACFAAFHGNLSQLMYAFVIGCLFAWLYLQTGKIWVPMLLHFAINLMGIVVAPAALGNETASIILSYMVIGLIVGAVMIFVMLRKRIFATLQPPTEAGWPYTPPKQPAFAAPYGGAVPGGAAPWQRPLTPPGQGGYPYGAPPPQNPQQAPPPYG